MRGFSIFARFREKNDCLGLSMEELRRRGVEEDRRDLILWRVFFRYKPEKRSKRKGALIQAVEAVEKYLAKKTTGQEAGALDKNETLSGGQESAGQ
jgi:glucitol operon activator protein